MGFEDGPARKRVPLTAKRILALHLPALALLAWLVLAVAGVTALQHWLSVAIPVLAGPIWLFAVGCYLARHADPRPFGEGHCPSCDYDRSAVNWDVCPECGDRWTARTSGHRVIWLATIEIIFGGMAAAVAIFIWIAFILA